MNKIIKQEKENVVYQNKFVTVYDDDVLFPNGKNGKYIRFMWNRDYGVAVLATSKEKDRIVLVYEYSYREFKWGWNIPKGMGENEIEPIEQAKNELEEESGLKSLEISYLFNLKEVVGTEQGVLFFRSTVDTNEKADKGIDEGEAISNVRLFSKEDALKMIYSGEISCYHTAVAVFYWLSEKD